MNLTLTKTRLKGAQTGHSLLAKKRDALTTRFRQILKKVDEVSRQLQHTGPPAPPLYQPPLLSPPLSVPLSRFAWLVAAPRRSRSPQAKRLMGRVLQLASFSLAEVTYTAGDISYQVQESVRKASYTVRSRQDNVSGVILPAFEGVRDKEGSGELASVGARRGPGHFSALSPLFVRVTREDRGPASQQ